jgi:hypothetical protein
MSKKNRRGQRRIATTGDAAPASTVDVTPAAQARPLYGPRGSSAKVDLNQEYQYVFSDLRKVGLIALAMFSLLIVLSFVLK